MAHISPVFDGADNTSTQIYSSSLLPNPLTHCSGTNRSPTNTPNIPSLPHSSRRRRPTAASLPRSLPPPTPSLRELPLAQEGRFRNSCEAPGNRGRPQHRGLEAALHAEESSLTCTPGKRRGLKGSLHYGEASRKPGRPPRREARPP
jgi:hypothetical protein